MPDIQIIPTIPQHFTELLWQLEGLSKEERYRFGADKEEILLKIYKRSIFTDTILADGRVVWIIGLLGEYLGEKGYPWSLFCPAGEAINPFIVICFYRKIINKMLQFFPRLIDMVDVRHTKVIRTLKMMGFVFGEPEYFNGNIHIQAERKI